MQIAISMQSLDSCIGMQILQKCDELYPSITMAKIVKEEFARFLNSSSNIPHLHLHSGGSYEHSSQGEGNPKYNFHFQCTEHHPTIWGQFLGCRKPSSLPFLLQWNPTDDRLRCHFRRSKYRRRLCPSQNLNCIFLLDHSYGHMNHSVWF